MDIVIEPVKISEANMLANISRKTFYDTFREQNTEENMDLFLNESFNLQTLQRELEDPANHFFFAKSTGEVVGYVKLSESEPPAELANEKAIEIARIYTLQERIGSGVGKAMVEFAIGFGNTLQKQMVWLGVWEHNKRAIDFYRRFGFVKFSEHVFMVGNDAQTDWLMKKDLS
ncbi:MAG TPA: GNAT family N-acetyltransferase [Segetibacter sp.]|jgi:ribosomal protein S18 acetylase RimI-like enzyme